MKNEIVGFVLVFLGAMLVLLALVIVTPFQKSSVDIEMRFKRGQSLNIEINGDQKRISLDNFVLEVMP